MYHMYHNISSCLFLFFSFFRVPGLPKYSIHFLGASYYNSLHNLIEKDFLGGGGGHSLTQQPSGSIWGDSSAAKVARI